MGPVSQIDAKRAGWVQGVTIAVASAFPAFVTTGTAPSLPKIASYYSHVPGHDVLVPLVLGIPSLMLALLSPITGLCVDAIGGRRVLTGATILFGAASIGCYLASSLQNLVIGRAVVGVALSGVLVSCDALLGAYFQGALREKWIGIQMIVFCAFTIVVGIVAGALGDIAWRTVFLLGATGLLMLPVYLGGLWHVTPATIHSATPPGQREGYPWLASVGVFSTTVLLAYLTFAPLFNAGFILQGRGIDSGVDAGIALALSAVGGIPASVAYSLLPRLTVASRCAVTGALAALAFSLLGIPGLPGVLASMCVIGMALGFGIPTLVGWMLSVLQPSFRGRGMGMWQSMMFIGQFAAAPGTALLSAETGGIGHAMTWLGIISGVFAVGSLGRRSARRRAASERRVR